MPINIMDFPTSKQPSTSEVGNTQYIHQFGYHFAKRLLGEKQVNKVCRQAYESELQNPKQNQQHCFRANWRSNVHMPWNLPISIPSNFLNEDEVNPKCLFVDVTFDFLIFPSEVVSEGRTKHCHVIKKADFWGEEGNDMSDEANSIAVSVAIRIGALVAMPSCQCSGISSTSGNKRDVDSGIKSDYQYYYMRGEKALTVADLDDHCSSIEIIREGMESKDVANIVGNAFLDGCNSAIPWQVVAKKKSIPSDNSLDDLTNDLTTIDGSISKQSTNQSTLICHLKLHDESFNADGILPLSSNGGVGSSLDRSMLDMILLQSNTNSGEGNIVPVPKIEALSLWKVVDESLIKALEKPIEPSPQKMSPASLKVAAKAEESPPQKAAPKKEEETKSTEQPRKVVIRRPPKPQEQALFARGKKTTLGGGRRKKPKFRMGPA